MYYSTSGMAGELADIWTFVICRPLDLVFIGQHTDARLTEKVFHLLLSAQCISSIGQIIKSVCVSVSE